MTQFQSKLQLLGTGTCQLNADRIASSVLIELATDRIVYDFGRGIAQRITDLGYRQDDLQHIVISHFHPDHFSDLIPYLHAACWSRTDPRNVDLNIYGPQGLKTLLDQLIQVIGSDGFVTDRFNINLFELSSGTNSIAGLNFEYLELPPASNHGMRFKFKGKQIAITGDSSFHEQEINFLQGVDFAIFDSGHLSDEEIVQLASAANCRVLCCSHCYRELEVSKLQEASEKLGFTGKLLLGHDLLVLL